MWHSPLLDAVIIEPGHLDVLLLPAMYSEALAQGCEARFESLPATAVPPSELTTKIDVLSGGNTPLVQRKFSYSEFPLCAEIWQGEPDSGLLRSVSIHGETVSLDYDRQGRLIRRTHKDTLKNSEERVTRYEYPAIGEILIDGPRDDVNDVRHVMLDEYGNVVGYINAAGHRFAMEYERQGRLSVWTGPNGDRREYECDDEGRLILERVAAGTRQETAMELDYDDTGRLIASRRLGEGTIRRHYDEEGRLASVSDDDGASLQLRYAWDGTLDGVFASEEFAAPRSSGGEGIATSLSGGSWDSVSKGSPSLPSLDEAMFYERDMLGRVTSATLADGSVTQFEHNGFGEVIGAHSSSHGTTRYEFDVVGNQMREYGEDGTEIWRAFDTLGRVTLEDFQLPGALPQRNKYHYDSCAHGVGRLCEVRSGAGVTRYEYDVLGNAIELDALAAGTSGAIRHRRGFEAQRLLSGGLRTRSDDGTGSQAIAKAETGAKALAQPGSSAPSIALLPSTASSGYQNIVFYSSFSCSGYGHPGVHVDSLAEAWNMGFRSFSLLADVTVYLENGDVLSGQAYVCYTINIPNTLTAPSTGYVDLGPPSSSPPPEQAASIYKLGICTRNVSNVNVPQRVGSVPIPANVRASLNSAIPDHQDAMLVKGSNVLAKGLHPVSQLAAVEEAALHLTLKELPSTLRNFFFPSLSASQWDSNVPGTILNASPMPSVDSTTCDLSEVTGSRYNTALAEVNAAVLNPPDFSLLYRHCQHWARQICK